MDEIELTAFILLYASFDSLVIVVSPFRVFYVFKIQQNFPEGHVSVPIKQQNCLQNLKQTGPQPRYSYPPCFELLSALVVADAERTKNSGELENILAVLNGRLQIGSQL